MKNTSKRLYRARLIAFARGLVATALGLSLGASMIASATALSDQPVFSTSTVPGNLALSLSVEWPTASRTAHVDNYSHNSNFLGYFDPAKCYAYQVVGTPNRTGTGDESYFYPTRLANNRQCNGVEWSGNFLNWAATATIDPFRWAMTGGRRVVDTASETILEKGWHSGQGLFDARDLPVSEIAGATPFTTATGLNIQVNGLGYRMRLTAGAPSTGRSFTADYYENSDYRARPITGTPVATVLNDSADHIWNGARPVPSMGDGDNFSARYTGTFIAPETGTYQFQGIADDGVQLKVDGVLAFDGWKDQGATAYTSGPIAMTAGQSFSLDLEYYQGGGGAELHLLWRKPSSTTFSIFTSDATTTDYTMRTKVCVPGLLEGNCKAYGANYKPEGLIQQYADKMRFSAFGYLNDSSNRDGGVLRARQKFVGPTYPVPGTTPSTNGNAEWDANTGQFVRNPDPTDAANTETATGLTIADSGVMNYLNQFGQIYPGGYKNLDPVNELYYAALRYYRNLGNVSSWSDTTNTGDMNTRRTWVDGFPVITNWGDPVQYACQRNFVLGIGDIYTHKDKNVPGNTRTDDEPTMPPEITADTFVNAMTATDKVGSLQGMGPNLSAAGTGASNSSDYMAGLAYDANARDNRPDFAGKQTIQTYWVDVLEQPFSANNKFYLAAKFGGLNQKKMPTGFDPYAFTGPIPLDWWSTTGDLLPGNIPRPDNYFTAGRPDTMVAGLKTAFERISNEIDAYTTSFSLSTVQVQASGAASYGAQYDAAGWTGTLTASQITFDAAGNPSSVSEQWSSASKLEAQLAGTGWDINRRIATWSGSAGVPFRSANLSSRAAALDPGLAGATSASYLNYLRGDRSNEKTDLDATKPYRKRPLLLGDIVNAKVTPYGPPNKLFSESLNPGYSAFKTSKSTRSTMVYVGANDGMLHAFNGALTGPNAGLEQFAYVPSALFDGPSGTPQLDGLAQLGNPNYQHHNYVDATPKAFDIDFNNAGGAFATTNAATSDWRSVVIGGLGKGGKSFYAIDVTDPDNMTTEAAVASKVLWEFTDASTMGYSFGAPTVIKTKKYGWVVVLTSGYNNTGGGGYGFIYVLDPRNGNLLERVQTATASDGLAQLAAYVQDFTDSMADAVYGGDLNGQMWRFDLNAPRTPATAFPQGTLLVRATDGAAKAQPITTPPLIEIQPNTRKRFVLFGTGQLLDPTDVGSTDPQSYYAVIDGSAGGFAPATAALPVTRSQLTPITDVTTGVTLSASSPGWYIDFGVDAGTGIGWRLVNNATTFSGIVAFAPLLTSGDACSPSGRSRLYAIDFATGRSVLDPAGTPYVDYANALTDIKFLSVDGIVRLVTGDVRGQLRRQAFQYPAGTGVRLLNWREIPTVD